MMLTLNLADAYQKIHISFYFINITNLLMFVRPFYLNYHRLKVRVSFADARLCRVKINATFECAIYNKQNM